MWMIMTVILIAVGNVVDGHHTLMMVCVITIQNVERRGNVEGNQNTPPLLPEFPPPSFRGPVLGSEEVSAQNQLGVYNLFAMKSCHLGTKLSSHLITFSIVVIL